MMKPGKSSKARVVNGVIAALITIIFLVHGTMGSLSALFGFSGALAWVVWGAVILACLHVVVSALTSAQQLTDKEFPPSRRKKAHLALKWVTGGLLAVAAIAHIILPKSSVAAAGVIVAVSVVLAVHVWVGSKSLLTDLGFSRRYMWPLRIVVCLFAALFVVVMLRGIL
ncbi:MAG: hypothetical protein IJ111_15680 [Eggerthellaceae bacterium]|nr:hypothetical protein [Eggerthellaceae bacterium]MBQ9044242.1 hypothetical protein [Eggerthellaceae bacterium]